jgi:ribosomal protein S18 acetylase RimI-like enzyme
VGSIIGTHDGRKGWLNRLAVAKEYRRTGLGNRLVKEAERRLNALGLEVIACPIGADNEVSMKVFTRLSYGNWDGFYFSKRKSGGA